MKAPALVALVVIIAAAAGSGGFRLGRERSEATSSQPQPQPQAQAEQHPAVASGAPAPPPAAGRKVLYYRDPMGKPDYLPVPKKDEMGMDYIPVYEDEEAPLAPAPADSAPGAGQRQVLYYRNPMGLPHTSPLPKKDPMGMDYIPVYADGAGGNAGEDGALVRVSPARVQMLGVRTEAAAPRTLVRPVRAVGTVQFSERQLAVVSTKFEGWIERLIVNTTGEAVRRGAPLMQIYSPVLVQTQQEYVDAETMGASLSAGDAESLAAAERLVEGALQRLRYLDFPDAELRRLRRERRAARTVTWPAPFSGIVLEKMAFEGMRFMPGEPLYRIGGISPIWVIAEVFEQDLAQVAVGQRATVTIKAYPGRTFDGRVAYIYPTLGAETRTGKVRIELPNPRGELKADMYASVEVDTPAGAAKVLAVPDSAVIDDGTRQVVLIDRGEGRFEPRPVRTGTRADGYAEVLEGVQAGERVVVSANFLIDAESNLKAALGSFSSGEPQHR